MKKFFYKISVSNVLSILLTFVAAITSGGAAMAIANPVVGDNGSDTDPNDHPNSGAYANKLNATAHNQKSGNLETLNDATPDSPNKGIDQAGHASTASTLDEAGLVEKQLRDYVDKYKAHKYPMAHDFGQLARQIKVDVKDPTNWEIGEAILEAPVKTSVTAYSGSSLVSGYDQDFFNLDVYANDAKIFSTNSTILVEGITGYDESGINPDGNPLMLLVISKSGATLTCMVVNGKKSASGDWKVLPADIPAGTTLYAMAPAMSESEIEIEPDNVLPKQKQVYLQKKVCAITWTELFQRIEKKASWNVQDIKDAALDRYRRKYTRTMLISAPSKFYKHNDKTGTEIAYTQNGILRQMRLGYQLSDAQLDFNDLIAISAMMFGKYDTPNTITAYCGTKFIQRLLNIDFTKHNEFTVRNYTDETTKIAITSFECNFGKIEFKHEYGLDDLGYSECAVLFPVKEAKHFYYQNGKTINIDHEKGEGGNVREAKTQYFVQDDCVELGGFNNMIVGPAELISGYKLSALDTMVSVNKLSDIASPSDGMYAYLIADLATADSGNPTKMGLYKYATDTWVADNGKEIYV